MQKDRNIVVALNRVLTESFGSPCYFLRMNVEVETSMFDVVPLQGLFELTFSFACEENLTGRNFDTLGTCVKFVQEHAPLFGGPSYEHVGLTLYGSVLQRDMLQAMLEHSRWHHETN